VAVAASGFGPPAAGHRFREDASKIRTGRGPKNMATLRKLAINALRHNGHTNIAAGLRHTSYNPFTRPLDLLGIA